MLEKCYLLWSRLTLLTLFCKVDFTSLIDVRSLNPNKSESAITVDGQINGTTGGESTAVAGAQENNKNEGNQAQARGPQIN